MLTGSGGHGLWRSIVLGGGRAVGCVRLSSSSSVVVGGGGKDGEKKGGLKSKRRPISIQNLRRGDDPYQTPLRKRIGVVQKYRPTHLIKEDLVLFERMPTVYTRISGVLALFQNGVTGVSGAYFCTVDMLDDYDFSQKFLLFVAACGISVGFTYMVMQNLSKTVLRLRVLKNGFLEITIPPVIPFFQSNRIVKFELASCSIFRNRLRQVSNKVGYHGKDREKDAFSSIYVELPNKTTLQYSMDMRYATYLDVDGILQHVNNLESLGLG